MPAPNDPGSKIVSWVSIILRETRGRELCAPLLVGIDRMQLASGKLSSCMLSLWKVSIPGMGCYQQQFNACIIV